MIIIYLCENLAKHGNNKFGNFILLRAILKTTFPKHEGMPTYPPF